MQFEVNLSEYPVICFLHSNVEAFKSHFAGILTLMERDLLWIEQQEQRPINRAL